METTEFESIELQRLSEGQKDYKARQLKVILRPNARRALVNHPLLGRGEIDSLVFDGLILRGDAKDFQRLAGELSNQY